MKTQAKAAPKAETGRASGPFFSGVQAKLNVNTPGDAHEREADTVANAVVRKRGPMAQGGPIAGRVTPRVQRVPADTAQTSVHDRASDPAYSEHEPIRRADCPTVDDEPLQMADDTAAAQLSPEAEMASGEAQMTEETVQTAEDAQMMDEAQTARDAGPRRAPSARAQRLLRVERQLAASRGRGNPLPESVRTKMEAGLSADLSGIRIHTDTPAALMTRLLGAKAFASGRDIYFSPHRYAPGTERGDLLLAHELAHSLQQGAVALSPNGPRGRTPGAQRVPESDQMTSHPASLTAIRHAREHIGQINTKTTDAEGNRTGWQRLLEIFRGAFDGDVIAPLVIRKPILKDPGGLPHWCGIFAWSMLRKAGVPLPPWQLGKSILPHVGVRPEGELPKKGDIAYRDKWPGLDQLTHHQALVTGVESVETATGKPFDAVMIRTVDGNTAGSDNAGGQVEESWLPARFWKHFFDPTAKVSLPDVPLVTTDRASEDTGPVEATETDAATSEVAPAPEVTQEPTRDLPGDVLGPPAEEVAVDLPPEPDASVEPPALVEALSLSGKSEDATDAFLTASPSQMAISAPAAAGKIGALADGEKADAADDPPVLKVDTGNVVDPGVTAPGDIPVPGDAGGEVTGKGPETGDLTPEPYEEKGKPPSTDATREKLKKQPEGGFLDWLRNQFASILAAIRTTDDGVNTSAGPRKRVALTGKADPGQMGRQRAKDTETLRAKRDARVAEFRGHPGQSKIQPKPIREDRAAPISKEPAEAMEDITPTDGMTDYVDAALPKEVRDAADAKIAPDLHANLSEAREEASAAAATRDADKAAATAQAEADAATANRRADDAQREAVAAGRGDVARRQSAAIEEAYGGVTAFATAASARETAEAKTLRENVAREEGRADAELDKGEAKARKHKVEEEAKAAAKKRELKEKKEKQGLLDRAVGFVKDVIDKISKAIDVIFEGLRALVMSAIKAAQELAIGIINAARDAAIATLEGFRDWAKSQVDTYVGTFFPDVAKSMNEAIDSTVNTAVAGVNAAADGAIEKVNEAAEWLASKVNAILDKFKAALKGAIKMAGAIMTGDFAGAARIAIETACELAGVDSAKVLDFMDRAGSQIAAILRSPGKFINNVMIAIGTGVRNFADNFGQHFKTGAIEWLTGALSSVPVTLPAKWDLAGIFSLVAQILGLTYDNIKSRIILKLPGAAKVFDLVEQEWTLIKMLWNRDFSGLWEEVKTRLSDLKQTVIDGVKNWAITNVIKEGVIWLLSLLNPASALVKAIKLIADLIFWLIDNFERIKTFVTSVYTAVSNIASGVIGPAAKAVEGAMARSVPVVISFVASAIGLGGIGEAVQDVIQKVTAPINKMIDKVIDKVVGFAKKLLAKVKSGAKKVKDAVLNWWKAKRPFTSKDGGSHNLYYKGEGAGAVLWIASTPTPIAAFLDARSKDATDPDQKAIFKTAKAQYATVLKHQDALTKLIAKDAPKSQQNAEERAFRDALDALTKTLRGADMAGAEDIKTHVTFSDGGTKQAYALPLTRLEGNTKGSAPKSSAQSPEWSHAIKLDTVNAKRQHGWVRGHLLNDNLHGPGENRNLVPITQKMNSEMRVGDEAKAKSFMAKSEEPMYYKATATFWSGAPPVNRFPRVIEIDWGIAKKSGDSFVPGEKKGGQPYEMSEAPPATAVTLAPSIAAGTVSQLVTGITPSGTVTTHFVSTHLAGQSFGTVAKMKEALYLPAQTAAGEDSAAAITRAAYVDATASAIAKGDIRL